MKSLLTLIFILSSTLSYSAGTDSGGNSSSNDPKGPSSNNNVDVNIEYHRAKKLIYKKKQCKSDLITECKSAIRVIDILRKSLYN